MADIPILFSGPMVQAILREIRAPGTGKTQTRRLLKPQPDASLPIGGADFVEYSGGPGRWCWLNGFDGSIIAPFDAPYATGDRLWVKETHYAYGHWEDTGEDTETGKPKLEFRRDWTVPVCFEAPSSTLGSMQPSTVDQWHKRPSLFLHKCDSRITMPTSDVRVQRLQEISEADAVAEGVEKDSDGWFDYQMPNTQCCASAVDSFPTLWDSLNADRAPLASNPWVVAISFKPHLCNIDQMEAAA